MRRIATVETADDGPLPTAPLVNYSAPLRPEKISNGSARADVALNHVGPTIVGVAAMSQLGKFTQSGRISG